MAKLSGARLAQAIGDAAVDLLGLEGLGDASPDAAIQGRAAALYRASVGSTIAGGTAEVQQLVIARAGWASDEACRSKGCASSTSRSTSRGRSRGRSLPNSAPM